MKRASTMWTTVARAPLAERGGRARTVLRARRTSHNVSSRRLQSAPKARQEAAAKEHLAPLPGASRVASRQERAMNLEAPGDANLTGARRLAASCDVNAQNLNNHRILTA